MYRLRDRFEWRSSEKVLLRQLIKDSNCALQRVLLEAHAAARRYQIRLERGDLKACIAIPFNAVVGTFPSDVHREESGLLDVVPYREVILQRIRVMMRSHESQEVATGYDQDLFVSNLWLARPNHIKPSVNLEWVSGGTAGNLFAIRGRATFDLQPGAELTVDLNQVCGNSIGDSQGSWLQYPTRGGEGRRPWTDWGGAGPYDTRGLGTSALGRGYQFGGPAGFAKCRPTVVELTAAGMRLEWRLTGCDWQAGRRMALADKLRDC
jgi:hypothetical protein